MKILKLAFVVLFVACNGNSKERVLTAEKLLKIIRIDVADCSEKQDYFRMNKKEESVSYTFEKCLPENHYSAEKVSIEQKQDTVTVRFTGSRNGNTLYKVELDVPKDLSYKYITIDEDTYEVVSSLKQ